MYTNGKALYHCMALTIALWPAANANDSDGWIRHARNLSTRDFMQECDQVLMNAAHIEHHSYLMSHFADEVTDLCHMIAPNPDQGSCRSTGFESLNGSLKRAFFRQAVQHAGTANFPVDLVASWGDAGYIISDKSNVEKDALRNDLCSEVYSSIGEDFIDHIPDSKIPIVSSNEPKRMSPPVSAQEEPSTFTVVQVEKEDNVLNMGAIISISCAVAALIVVFFYFEARRRKAARVSRSPHGNKGIDDDGATRVSTFAGGRNNNRFRNFRRSLSSSTDGSFGPVEEVKDAINNADWDRVYKLASQLAENDDSLSLPSLDSFNAENRSHLCAEDQERTKTLDELAASGDWTGLAVTAALYAGETSASSHDINCGIDSPSSRRQTLSPSQSQDVEEGCASMEQMVSGLGVALNAGNWSQVSKYANLIKDQKNACNSFDTDTDVIESSSASVSSAGSNDTEMSKKQTIEKLMRSGKWKGVSIMANMYEMESKQQISSTSVRPYPNSPSHPYTERRSIVRTKELQHEDRVQENIVSFRQDP